MQCRSKGVGVYSRSAGFGRIGMRHIRLAVDIPLTCCIPQFAQQCGVLALDEPTTNLDVDNIEALANSLAG